MKKSKLAFVCFTLSSVFLFSQFKKKEVDARETEAYLEGKKKIEKHLETILEKHEMARKLFQQASAVAAKETLDIMAKLSALQKKIDEGKEVASINKNSLIRAQKKHDRAKSLIGQFEYEQAREEIENGLKSIVTIPVVSLTVETELFSPDNDGTQDELKVTTKVSSHTNIAEWKIEFFQSLLKANKVQYVKVKEDGGKGQPPKKYSWNGILEDGKTKVSSANTYAVQVTVKDMDEGVGQSTKVTFKTDIFVIKHKRGLMIDISAIQFAYDSAKIQFRYRGVLSKLYDKLQEYSNYVIAVEGHTDSAGTALYNKKLSERRARSVSAYLIRKGMGSKRIKPFGVGEVLPKTLDLKKMGLNRRVNFFLFKNAAQFKTYNLFIRNLNFNREIQMNEKKDR